MIISVERMYVCRFITPLHRARLDSNLLHSVIDGVAFDGVEAGVVATRDDLLFGHFYFAAGFDLSSCG
jgi:hypothetical protein